MIYQNKIFLGGKSTRSDIIILSVNSYLSPKFIKAAALFQSYTHAHAHYEEYSLSKLPVFDRNSVFQIRPILLLVGGLNSNIKIKVQLIRIINIGATAMCLVRDKFQQSQNRFFPLIIIFPDAKKAQSWCSKCQYLSAIWVYDPYLNFASYYQNILIVARFDSLVVQQSYNFHDANWNDSKQLANIKFREKKYKEALILYEAALGMLWDFSRSRDRAILYSNASQSFLDLSLNQNSLQYANAAIAIDKTFIKSYYRKLCSLLQLKQFIEIPPILAIMNRFCSKEQFTSAHQRYTRHLANQTGLYNWFQIFMRRSTTFGQYLNTKVVLKSNYSNQPMKFYATSLIKQYELVAVQKNALYIAEVNTQDNELMPRFLSKLKDLVDLDSNFFEKIITSPLIKQIIHKKGEDYMDAVVVEVNNYIHCFQSIYMDQISIEVCPDYVFFVKNYQSPNCTLLSLNGAFFYFALRDIEPDEPLSADLFNKIYEQPQKSLLLLNGDPSVSSFDTYLKYKEQFFRKKMFKTAILYLWRAVRQESIEYRTRLTKQFSQILQLYPLWEIAILVLCQLRKSKQFTERKYCESTLVSLFEKCFKLTRGEASQIISKLTSD